VHKDKEFFHALIENSLDVITILSTDGTILYESPSVYRLLGYSLDELLGRNAFDMIHPDDGARARDALSEIVENRNSVLSAEFRFRHRNGSWRVIEATGSNQLDNPFIAGIVVNSRDVTERKKAEELLREANKRAEDERAKSEAIIMAIGDGISIQDKTFKVLYQNQAHRDIVGGDKSGKFCYVAYTRRDDICEDCPLVAALRDGKTHTAEKSVLRDDGVIHLEIKGAPLRDSTGTIVAGIEAVRDITRRKEMEEKLRESEERFRRIFEDCPLGIIIADLNHRVLRANREICKMMGYTEEELIGHSIEDITYSEDVEKSAKLTKKEQKGKIPLFQVEKRYVKKNGEILWINFTATTIRDPEGKVLYSVGMIEDISERKITEEEKEDLISQLKDALANIKTLKGLIPICAWCKRIRDDKGYWTRVETYIRQHSDASFTHGICPECLRKEDPHTYEKVFQDEKEARDFKIQKRQFERIRLRKPFTCVVKVGGGSENIVLHAALEDISEAGMCIRTDYPVEQDSFLISGNGAEDKIGIVQWRRPASTDSRAYSVGIKFVQD